jgi:hypothetical protein
MERLPSIVVAAIICFSVASVSSGSARLVGQGAIDSFRCFNLYLDYNRAHIEEDFVLMNRVALQIEELSGNSDALEFSAYAAGYSTSADSHRRTDLDALHWAQAGADWLNSTVAQRDKPWSGIQLAAYIYAERIVEHTGSMLDREKMLNSFEAWLASGGGPDAVSSLTADSYRSWLTTAPAERDNYIINVMSRKDTPE